jgi:hypothetical protein
MTTMASERNYQSSITVWVPQCAFISMKSDSNTSSRFSRFSRL